MTVDIFWTLYSVYKNIIFPYLLDDYSKKDTSVLLKVKIFEQEWLV